MSRYIDMEWLKDYIEVISYKGMWHETKTDEFVSVENINSAPSIDIVRCQDCKYWVYNFNGCSRNPCTEPWYATDFCSYGEREGE